MSFISPTMTARRMKVVGDCLYRQQRLRLQSTRRHASSDSKIGFTLEKPDKFRPPSHPSRIVAKKAPRNFPGPPLSAEELAAQKTKRYPNTMAAEGTFTHWFIHARKLHVGFAITVLTGMTGYVWLADFHKHNKFPDLLPPKSLFWTGHPFQYLGQYVSVYKMHVEARSVEVGEQRRKNIEDAAKRKEFLKEHGLWKEKWWLGEEPTPEERAAQEKARLREKGQRESMAAGAVAAPLAASREGAIVPAGAYRDFEGNTAAPRKWFGIW